MILMDEAGEPSHPQPHAHPSPVPSSVVARVNEPSPRDVNIARVPFPKGEASSPSSGSSPLQLHRLTCDETRL